MKYLIICIAFSLISCSGTSQEDNKNIDVTTASSQKESCLAEMTDPTEWYSLSSAAAIANVPEESLKQVTFKAGMKYLKYTWKNERMSIITAGKGKMEMPARNEFSIGIKNLDKAIEEDSKRYNRKFTYDEYFDAYYGPITKKDKQKIEEEVDKKGAEEESFDTKTAKKALSYMPQGRIELEDLGGKAHYYIHDSVMEKAIELIVFHRNVVIVVAVELSADDEEDLQVAKKIAQDLMKLCD